MKINRISSWIPVLLKTIMVLCLLCFGVVRAQSDSNGFDKVDQEWGTQDKGNAYGVIKDKWYDDEGSSGLGGMSSAAPLPPLSVFALLGGVFALKAWKSRRSNES